MVTWFAHAVDPALRPLLAAVVVVVDEGPAAVAAVAAAAACTAAVEVGHVVHAWCSDLLLTPNSSRWQAVGEVAVETHSLQLWLLGEEACARQDASSSG